MKNLLLLIFLSLSFNYSIAQEICDNGIDDDNNGLIDLNDPSCECDGFGVPQTISSLVPNPSFEDRGCCPSNFSQLNCADTWIQATNATSDYFNCGYTFGSLNAAGITAADGTGFVGAIYSDNWKEYVGSCLISPMLAGQTYTLSFDIASVSMSGNGGQCNMAYGDVDVSIYGATNCGSLPLSTTDCPSNASPAWSLLGAETYTPSNSWGIITIEFTPTTDINAIMIGSPCNLPASYNGACYPYFLYDDLILASTNFFNSLEITENGGFCTDNLELTASADSVGGDWQWYYDGAAIVGETNSTLDVSANGQGPGEYNVRYTIGTRCEVTDYIVDPPQYPTADFDQADICFGENMNFTDLSTIDNTGGVLINSWEWDFDNSNNSIVQNPSQNYGSTGNYDVQLLVSGNNGCEDSITKSVIVHELPSADFNFDTLCVGNSTTFSDLSSANGGTAIDTWVWDFDDGNTANTQNTTNTYANAGDFDVSLNVTSVFGCTSESIQNVLVYDIPTADFTFTNACFYDSLSFVNSSSSFADGFLWDFDDASTSTLANPNHEYASDGAYDVTLSVSYQGLCTNSTTKTVYAYAQPSPAFSDASACLGDASVFNDNTTITDVDGDLVQSWNWDFGDGNVSTLENPTHTYLTDDVYTIKLVATSNYGCTDSVEMDADIWPLPIADFSFDTVCIGNNTNFNDLSVANGGTPIDTWFWNFDDGNTSNVQSPSHLYTSDGNYAVNLNVTSVFGCSDNSTQNIIVYAIPTADFSFTNECFYDSLSFTNTSSAIANGFEWNFDDGSTATVPNLNHLYSSEGAYDVQLIVSYEGFCHDTVVKTVHAYAQPNPAIQIDSVCFEDASVFVNNTTISNVDGDFIQSWNWNFGDGNTSILENPTNNYADENIYSVDLVATSNFGCTDSIQANAVVWPLPVVDFTPTSVCLEDDSEFTDLSTISNSYTSNSIDQWEWDFGDGTSSNLQNPSNGYLSDGTFSATLTVTSNHGCSDDVTKTVIVHPLPDVNFNGVEIEGCSPICPQVTTASTINSPSIISEYVWTLSDGTTYTGNSFSDCFENLSSASEYYDLTLTATSNEGCINEHSESDYIIVHHNPIADFYYEPEEPSVIQNEVDFFNTSLYADNYEWFFGTLGTSFDINPIFEFPPIHDQHQVVLVAKTVENCTDTIIQEIDILDKIVFYIPNTFTPDNNKFNETFQPVFTSGFDPQEFHLMIFNRWGEVIFESNDASRGWDGTYGLRSGNIVKEGTYVWKIVFKETMSDKRHTHTGHVNLLR